MKLLQTRLRLWWDVCESVRNNGFHNNVNKYKYNNKKTNDDNDQYVVYM